MKFGCFIILFLLMAGIASGHEYTLIAKENGEALVLITLLGNGTYTLNLPSDVSNVKVKGALYTIDENIIELAIGETEKAVMGYTTSVLTSKSGKDWAFDVETINDASITLYLPSAAVISKTEPQTYIDAEELKKMTWEDTKQIHVEYSFPTEEVESTVDNNLAPIFNSGKGEPVKTEKGTNPLLVVIIVLFLLIMGGMVTTVVLLKRNPNKEKTNVTSNKEKEIKQVSKETGQEKKEVPKKDESKKAHIFKTLPENEATIVRILHAHEGGMKRSTLEKESRIAKSSLASSLFNLEKKNIVEVDKTYTTHYVKFTEWFREL